MSNPVMDKLNKCLKTVREKTDFKPLVAIVLGSGLGDFVNDLKIDAVIDYASIKNFPKATNQNHKGKFVFTTINGKKVLVMQGRIHFYEGYTAGPAASGGYRSEGMMMKSYPYAMK